MSLVDHLTAARARIDALGAGRNQAETTLILCARAQFAGAERNVVKADAQPDGSSLARLLTDWAMHDLVSTAAYAHAVEIGRAYAPPAGELETLRQERDMWQRRARELESLCADRL